MAKDLELSPKRKKWVKQFKPTSVMRGKPLNYPATVQARYVRDVEKLIQEVIKETEKTVTSLFKSQTAKEYFANDESIASKSRIITNALIRKVESAVADRSKTITMKMLNGTNKASKVGLTQSLKELSGGMTIKPSDVISGTVKDRFLASIDSNVDLIKTISSDYLAGVKNAVNRSIMSGNGLEDLIPYLKDQHGMTTRRAKNMALDQTRKAYNSLNAARMQDVGVETYEWIHTGGSKQPREHHIKSFPAGLNGGIFKLGDPPIIDPKTGERGIPGQAINCKCRMMPVIKFDEGEPVDS